MIPQADLDAMRARWSGKTMILRPVTDGVRRGPITPTVREAWAEDAAARSDVPRLLDAYEELQTLARELAVAINGTRGEAGLLAAEAALAKAHAAGLLEPS